MIDTATRIRRATTPVERPVFERSQALLRQERDYVVPRHPDLMRATAAWMLGTFLLCYLALPVVTQLTGLFTGLLSSLLPAVPAFGLTLAVTGMLLHRFRPQVRIPRKGASLPSEPWIAASLGYFLVWAVLHSTLPWLQPLSWMSGTELATFLSMNLLEAGLFGLMLGSFAHGRRKLAFALGAGFSALFMALWSFFAQGMGLIL